MEREGTEIVDSWEKGKVWDLAAVGVRKRKGNSLRLTEPVLPMLTKIGSPLSGLLPSAELEVKGMGHGNEFGHRLSTP